MALFQVQADNMTMWAADEWGQDRISGESKKKIVWPEGIRSRARKTRTTEKSWIWDLIIESDSESPKSAIDETLYQLLNERKIPPGLGAMPSSSAVASEWMGGATVWWEGVILPKDWVHSSEILMSALHLRSSAQHLEGLESQCQGTDSFLHTSFDTPAPSRCPRLPSCPGFSPSANWDRVLS